MPKSIITETAEIIKMPPINRRDEPIYLGETNHLRETYYSEKDESNSGREYTKFQENNYPQMAYLISEKFGSRKIGIFAIDGSGSDAQKLVPYLNDHPTYHFFKKKGVPLKESCLEQGIIRRFSSEIRPIYTPPKIIISYLKEIGSLDDALILDDWAKGGSALMGAWWYFARHSKEFGIPIEHVYTAVFNDQNGAADICPNHSTPEYKGTRGYIRAHAPNAYFDLISNGHINPEREDKIFMTFYQTSGKFETLKDKFLNFANSLENLAISWLGEYPVFRVVSGLGLRKDEDFIKIFVDGLLLDNKKIGDVNEEQNATNNKIRIA